MTKAKQALFVLAIAFACFAWASYEAGFKFWPPGVRADDGSFMRYRAADVQRCAGARLRTMLGDFRDERLWRACAYTLAKDHTIDAFNFRYYAIVGFAGFGVAALFGFLIAIRLERPRDRIIRGRCYLKGAEARRNLRAASRAECRRHGAGLTLAPGVRLSRERETRHFLIWGSVGAGKTQTMLRLILGAIERGDKVLVLDTKGDMTASLPGDPALIAPQDARSFIWNVAADCRVKQDARELAARFIPASHDPMWSDAAREVFVACVAALQATKGTDWTWADLRRAVIADAMALFAMAKAYHPEAMRVLEDPSSRTAQSVLATFQAHMNVVGALGEAWAPTANAPRFSVRDWLQMEGPVRPIIVQRDARYPELSNAWISGLLGLLASSVGSPALTESASRRVWLFLDEFPQLPRMNDFTTFLDVGRSKGVIVVLGAQDIAQIRAIYGRERADAWIGVVGTQVITRLNPGRGAEEASLVIGDQEIEKKARSISTTGARATVTESRHRELRRVVMASELSNRLGPRPSGVRALILGPGDNVYEIDLPFIRLPQLRPAAIPSRWTQASPSHAAAPDRPAPVDGIASSRMRLSKDAAQRIRDFGR